uniref:Epidermal growth factor-like protein 7 n=1 Tax=Callithrix jacchus TaxID=9483 RepID=A0A8I3W8D3_CALJA
CPRGQLPHPQQSLQAPHTVAPAPLSLLFVRQHVSVISGEHTQEVRLERAHPNPDYPGRGIKSRPSSPGGSLPAPSRLPRTASREAPGDRTGRPASGGASRQGPGCIPRPGTQQQQPWPRLGSRSISPQGPGGTGGPAPRSSCSPGPRDDGFSSDSRRVCAVGAHRGPIAESFVQRVYQPFLTTCDGHRACSTYRTIYRTAYRRSPGLAPARPRYTCCPGWKRTSWLPGACGAAICQPPCRNGGSCVQPGHCRCPSGWQGDTCQSDVDECSAGRGHCPQRCINTAGSYWCQCWEGHSLSADGTFCVPKGGPPRLAPNPTGKLSPGCAQPGEVGRQWRLSCGSVRHGEGHWNFGGGSFSTGEDREGGLVGSQELGAGCLEFHLSQGEDAQPLGPVCAPLKCSGRRLASAGDRTLLLLVRAVTLQTRTVSNNALSTAPHPSTEETSAPTSLSWEAPRDSGEKHLPRATHPHVLRQHGLETSGQRQAGGRTDRDLGLSLLALPLLGTGGRLGGGWGDSHP